MMVYIAGTTSGPANNKMPTIYACQFNSTLKVMERLILEDVDIIFPVVLKRMPGYEYLAMGGSRHILIIQFVGNHFVKLRRIDNVHQDFIGDMAWKQNILYSKGLKESMVKVIRFMPPLLPAPTQAVSQNVSMINTTPTKLESSTITTTPKRYNNFTANKIQFDVYGQLEKVTVSKNGKLLYVGGANGVNLLKHEDNGDQYLQLKNEVD